MKRIRNRNRAIRLPLLPQTVVFIHADECKGCAKNEARTEPLGWMPNPMPRANADARERQCFDTARTSVKNVYDTWIQCRRCTEIGSSSCWTHNKLPARFRVNRRNADQEAGAMGPLYGPFCDESFAIPKFGQRQRSPVPRLASRALTSRFCQAKRRVSATAPRAARSSTVSVRVYSFVP
jgi:hypothetical protein